jgi:ferredoxin
MPKLTIASLGTFDVETGTRLANALETCGIDIGHRCGGKARCTTCRVRFQAGEPETFTRAEYQKLRERALLGQARLSCQIVVDHDMEVMVLMQVQDNGWADPGPPLDPLVFPEAVWWTPAALEQDA